MVSLEGSTLILASKVTVKGAGHDHGFLLAEALTVYLEAIVHKILFKGVSQLFLKIWKREFEYPFARFAVISKH